jgi:hypothetical protein
MEGESVREWVRLVERRQALFFSVATVVNLPVCSLTSFGAA